VDKKEKEGMGLGLSAVGDTMQARGESLWVTSKSRVDSTYKIYLPGIEEPTETLQLRKDSYQEWQKRTGRNRKEGNL